MKKLLFVLFFLNSIPVYASCHLAELYKEKNSTLEWRYHQMCADEMNDAASQFFIGQTYLNGREEIEQNLLMALKYFRMSSENGYAPAQRELAKLMDTLNDIGRTGQEAILELENIWQEKKGDAYLSMPALSWLMLAAERAENKWFYFAPALLDEEAARLLPAMKTKYGNDEVKKASLLATQWKQAQLLRQAKALLTDEAFEKFKTFIYPSKLEPPKISREQAVEELKKLKMSKSK